MKLDGLARNVPVVQDVKMDFAAKNNKINFHEIHF
jgi:hypothetical protein